MVEGILLIFGYSTKVLIDFGASHNFIFKQFSRTLSHFYELEELEMEIATPGVRCNYLLDVFTV